MYTLGVELLMWIQSVPSPRFKFALSFVCSWHVVKIALRRAQLLQCYGAVVCEKSGVQVMLLESKRGSKVCNFIPPQGSFLALMSTSFYSQSHYVVLCNVLNERGSSYSCLKDIFNKGFHPGAFSCEWVSEWVATVAAGLPAQVFSFEWTFKDNEWLEPFIVWWGWKWRKIWVVSRMWVCANCCTCVRYNVKVWQQK